MIGTATDDYEIASFWLRLGGYLIDGVVFFIGGAVLGAIIAGVFYGSDPEANQEAVDNAASVIAFAATYLALWIFNAEGRSPGKLAVGIKIIRGNGERPGIGPGFGRTVGAILSGIPLGLGYLWAAWDDDRQTWHDKLASTYVVRAEPISTR